MVTLMFNSTTLVRIKGFKNGYKGLLVSELETRIIP